MEWRHDRVLPVRRVQYEYEFDERGERVVLGKGTFGTVYAGRELTTQVKIAIKEFKESSSSECAYTRITRSNVNLSFGMYSVDVEYTYVRVFYLNFCTSTCKE